MPAARRGDFVARNIHRHPALATGIGACAPRSRCCVPGRLDSFRVPYIPTLRTAAPRGIVFPSQRSFPGLLSATDDSTSTRARITPSQEQSFATISRELSAYPQNPRMPGIPRMMTRRLSDVLR